MSPIRKNVASKVAGAKRAPASGDFFAPELAKLKDKPPKGDAWLHEVKWDGYRIVATVADGQVKLWSRNGLPWSGKIPSIQRAVEALGLDSARLDGELIALDDGQPDFNGLQKTLSGEAKLPLAYMLFDLPYLNGYDLSNATLIDRKAVLEALLQDPPSGLSYSSHVVGNGEQVFEMAVERKLEGIMCKRANSRYHGGRGEDWVKVKRLESDEYAVVGYTPGEGARKGFGSLLLATPQGKAWRYIGRVGSGFTDKQLTTLNKTLGVGGKKSPTVINPADAPKEALWTEPRAVLEAYFRGRSGSGLLRHPSLKGMRPDKKPLDLRDSDRA